MAETLYTLLIFPITTVLEVIFSCAEKVFHQTGLSVLCISAAVSLLCLPLYNVAETWQQLEREIQKRLAPKTARIKAVFRGDEQYLILSTFYRQNHYHPVYALRSSFGLLIQVPFFIAAYGYLRNLEALKGTSFLWIRDLGAPDGLFSLGGIPVNVLPVAMTAINILAGAIYTAALPLKEKLQIYGMALVFLLVLYTSPSGLVLYWTANNVFSLLKNAYFALPFKKKQRLLLGGIAVFAVIFAVFLLFFHPALFAKRAGAAALVLAAGLSPLALHGIYARKAQKKNALPPGAPGGDGEARFPPASALSPEKKAEGETSPRSGFFGAVPPHAPFLLAALCLWLLSGILIPSTLISSSVEEFSLIDGVSSPFPFIGTTALQSAGFFLVWFPGLYAFFGKKTKKAFTLAAAALVGSSLVSAFCFPGSYGFLTTTLLFALPVRHGSLLVAANLAAVFFASLLCVRFAAGKKTAVYRSALWILVFALAGAGVVNAVNIEAAMKKKLAGTGGEGAGVGITPVYHLSATGRNVMVIMLDRAIGGYVPAIFQEKPELEHSFADFTWYPNCVSFGGYTLLGVPPLFGGYDYAPSAMQARSDTPLVKKHNEALKVLPRLFSEAGWSVTVTDPPLANYSLEPDLRIFDDLPRVTARNIQGRYTTDFLRRHREVQLLSVSGLLREKLLRFSLFKTAPLFLRAVIYDHGSWLDSGHSGAIPPLTIDSYAALELLPDLTDAEGGGTNTYTAMENDLTHEAVFFQAPGYTPQAEITDRGSGPYAQEVNYHANMAALLLLGRYFDHLRALGVYDNTRIIVTSDHGWYSTSALPDFILPNGSHLLNFTPLFLYKDFNERNGSAENAPIPTGRLAMNRDFITHADTPFFATRRIIDGAVNPYTGRSLGRDKTDGVTIATAHAWEAGDPRKTTFHIGEDEWLHVKDDIFKKENWSSAKP